LSRPPAGGFRDGVDKLALRHARPFLDPDAGRELDELRLLVGIETAVRGLPIELARGALRGCRCPFPQVFDRR
jgi:hypothetical protein